MTAVIQRVKEASLTIEGSLFSRIGNGYVVLLGIRKGDTEENCFSIAKKIIDLRIFEDENKKMNLSLKEVSGEAMIVSQFTLCNDREKSGNRPSFTLAEEPKRAKELYELVISEMKKYYSEEKVQTGVFAAEMDISLINSGPVTIIMDSEWMKKM